MAKGDRVHELLILPLSGTETQVFALSKDGSILAPKSDGVWDQHHKLLVEGAKPTAQRLTADIEAYFLAGVYHFGHTLADQLERIFLFCKSVLSRGEGKIVMFNCPSSTAILFRLLGIEKYIVFKEVQTPTLIQCNEMLQLLEINRLGRQHECQLHSISLKISREIDRLGYTSHAMKSRAGRKILLSCKKYSRIANRESLIPVLQCNNWHVVDPLLTSTISLLFQIRHATDLVCENGSILLNAFLVRERPYKVLCSSRCVNNLRTREHDYSGFAYNKYHTGIFTYNICPTILVSRKHPFADMIHVDSSTFWE
jgi:hypothetical protein